MKIGLVIVAAGIALLVALFAFPSLWDVLASRRETVDDWISQGLSPADLQRRFDDAMRSDFQDLNEINRQIFEAKNEVTKSQANIASLQGQLKDGEYALQNAAAWIRTHGPGDTIVLNGKTLDYNTAVQKAQELVSENTSRSRSLEIASQAYSQNEAKVGEAEGRLEAAVENLQRARGEFKAKMIEYASWLALSKANDLNLSFEGFDIDSATARTAKMIARVDSRMNHLRADIEFQEKVSPNASSDTNPWMGKSVSASGLDAIYGYQYKTITAPNPAPVSTPLAETSIPIDSLIIPATSN